MVDEVTPGKWSLWATHPRHLGGIAELHATEAAAAVRAAQLRKEGYSVEVSLAKLPLR